MYTIKYLLTLTITFLCISSPFLQVNAQNIRINEIMASNLNLVSDEYGSYEDWIELYNAGEDTINLFGYGLSDDYNDPFKWVFPAWEIEPGGFLKVWASGKNLKPAEGQNYNGIIRSYYANISGTSVDDLIDHPDFPDNPTSTNIIINFFEAPTNIGDNYGQHLYTWLIPPMTGEYTFWIAGDDNSRLYLSTDETIENAELIAEVPEWTNPREWTKYPQQKSAKIYLEEGNKYYLSALMKEALGGDNLSVRWEWPDGSMEQPLKASHCILQGHRLHTNFSISASGEEILLTGPDSIRIDEVAPMTIPTGNSYGRQPDGSDEWFFFDQPTPEASNNTTGYNEITGKPNISPASGGIFNEPILVTIETDDNEATIYYTTNGSKPGPSNDNQYTQPIMIGSTAYIRAVAVSPGKIQSEVSAATFSVTNSGLSDFSSNLPLMVIYQFDSLVSPSNRTSAYMHILNSDDRVELVSTPDFEGRININIRGSSSQTFPKRGFGFHILEENGSNRKVSLLGMPDEHNWVLHGPYSDKSLMRNAVAYGLSNDIGQYTPRTRFVELFMHSGNGPMNMNHYHGVYLLVERIKDAPGRIEIDRVEPHQNDFPEITGGYIFKKDRLNPGESGFRTQRGSLYAHVRPDEQTITLEQQEYLRSYVDSIERVLFNPGFNDPITGYRSFLDVESFVDYHLLTELCKEIDGFRLSTFFYKDRQGKLILGPLWDYNLSLGNADYLQGWDPTGWYYPQISIYDYLNGWYNRLFLDPDFRNQYNTRYRRLRQTGFSDSHIIGKVMDYFNLLEEAQVRNFEKWPVLGRHIWPNWYVANTYEEEILWMSDWIRERLKWMDSQLGKPYNLIHYWNFNNEENYLFPSYTLTEASIEIIKEPETEITTGSGQNFSGVNARNWDEPGLHLRVNNPIGTELIFNVPGTNFQNLFFSYETRRSGSGANRQYISYTLDGQDYIPLDTLTITEIPTLHSFDFSEITQVNNNPDFAIKIIIGFDDDGSGGITGNNRFDNVTLDGEAMEGVNLPPRQILKFPDRIKTIENGDSVAFKLSNYFTDPDDDELTYVITAANPDMVNTEITVDHLKINATKRGSTKIDLTVGDGINPPIQTSFHLLVYPEAAVLSGSPFIFDYWNKHEPDGSFPDHMLFLQSDQNEPNLETPFLIAYHIPANDYSEADAANIGFPYRNENRTRINGLETNGVSFINTGRNRDLGAALLAVNTVGLDSVRLDWKASTIRVNSRVYHLRLQYRSGITANWKDFPDQEGHPVEYVRNETAGHSQLFEKLKLPSDALNQPYVQLRWVYYFTGEQTNPDAGARDMLALNKITISDFHTSVIGIDSWNEFQGLTVFPNPVSRNTLFLNKTISGFIYDITGNLKGRIDNEDFLNVQGFAPGVYILRSLDGESAKFIVGE
jgi:hypothetical protein